MLEVIVLDAGQGDAILVAFPDGSLMLVDCGCRKNNGVVSPEIAAALGRYLGKTGNKLKTLVLTHGHVDHYNLVEKLVVNQQVEIGTLVYGGALAQYGDLGKWIYKQKQLELQNQQRQVGEIRGDGSLLSAGLGQGYSRIDSPDQGLSYASGQGARYDVQVRILAANVGAPSGDRNASSVVLSLTHGDINVFLMGDATIEVEDFIVGFGGGTALTNLLAGRYTMLKVGHHGSPTASGPNWINALNPEVAVVSSDDLYPLPGSNVINRIVTRGRLLKNVGDHYYVQFNENTRTHEQVRTPEAMCSTLNLITPKGVFCGTSWYYGAVPNANYTDTFLNPVCGWNKVMVEPPDKVA